VNQPRVTLAAGMEVTPSVRLLSPLGAGGMGAVWLADHTALNTRVVVKFMLGGLDSSVSARARFKREAEAASQVKSPHVVQTFDYGVTSDGVPFIVMEHLEGRDLGQEITAKGALDPARVVAIVTQVSKALTKAHAANLLHRDIKPDNIFLCHHEADDELFVKLLDFGIAKTHTAEGAEITLDGQTKTGQVVGTPFYMSPEQVTAQKVIDLRSDLWSLGIVAFEALTGKRAFDGPSFGALAVKIATGDAPKPSESNPNLPQSVDDWFAKACAREPAKRFSTARELSDAFRAAFEGVVSLPPVHSGMTDSGSRGASSGPRAKAADAAGAASTPMPSVAPGPISVDDDADGRPSFVLASTIEGASGSEDRSSLARSEGGGAVAISDANAAKQRRPPLRMVGVLLAIVLLAIGIGIGIGRTGGGPTTSTATTSAVAAATETTAAPPKVTAAPSETSGPASAAVSVAMPLVVTQDAGVHTSVRPQPTTNQGGGRPRPVASVKPIESAAPPARPSAGDAGRHNDILF
jgi:eukaryotic-like serine/threonine-protein kinase